MEKIKYDKVVKLFKSKGYIIIGEYKNTITPVICEKNNYRYKISYSNLKNGKKPSLWGFSNLINLEYNINSLIKKQNSQVKFLSYNIITKNNKKRILLHFQCSCGKFFDRTLENAVNEKYLLCNNCQIIKRGKSKRLGKKIIEYIESKGYTVLDKTQVYRNSDYVEVEDSQGFKGFITYAHLKNRNDGMSRFNIRINKKYYIYNVNRYAKLQGINVECLDFVEEKLHTRQSLRFKCSCGNEFITSISSFQNGKTRCDVCSKSISRYEYIFKSYLESINEQYIYQYSYNQCRDVLPLPFDFYLKKYNALIEIDGEGHFHPCNFNQINNEKALVSFNSTIIHDKIKDNFCKENNIPLLRIPFTDFQNDKYKTTFQNFIEKIANLD